ncbi:hypothetical protein L596_000332 [Steinernema carpocapsae]|uniref:Uncharacterized protein n=1 Tax=Steinernema carpocapsae TaxID=34508 RepID=A0A4U8UHU5_STECR|nr:hypothetical protein L596_000332 [Steinernema carpocapsae]
MDLPTTFEKSDHKPSLQEELQNRPESHKSTTEAQSDPEKILEEEVPKGSQNIYVKQLGNLSQDTSQDSGHPNETETEATRDNHTETSGKVMMTEQMAHNSANNVVDELPKQKKCPMPKEWVQWRLREEKRRGLQL